MSVLRSLESKIARPRRRHVQPCLPVRGAPGRDRAQARARDGGAQVALGLADVRRRTSTACSCRRGTASASRTTRTRWRAELAGYLLEHARRERLTLLSRPVIEFETDDRLGLGEFGIQTRVVAARATRPVERAAPRLSPAGRWSTATPSRVAEPLEERARARAHADGAARGRRQAAGGRAGGRDARPQPPVRRGAERPERVAPARRDPAPRGVVGADRPRLDERLAAQRAPDRRLRGAQAGRRDRARRRR